MNNTKQQMNRDQKIDLVIKRLDESIESNNKRFNSLDASFKEIKESNNEILEAIGNYSNHVDERLEKVETSIGTLKTDMQSVKATLNTQVVKKSDLDDKFKEYFGENIVAPAKRLDEKTNTIVTFLEKKKIINEKEANSIRSMQIFPRPNC